MPNTEVKRLSAESSWGISPCEDRTLPGNNAEDDRAYDRSFFCLIETLSLLFRTKSEKEGIFINNESPQIDSFDKQNERGNIMQNLQET